MNIITIIRDVLVMLQVVYSVVAIVAAWHHRDWAAWRFLPLVAALSLAALWIIPPHAESLAMLLAVLLLAGVALKVWQGLSLFDRGLRMLSVFWCLWCSLFALLAQFGYP